MKFIKLAQLRAIALHADVVCDVAGAIRNSLEAHVGHRDGHLVSVPESISDLIGLAEAEVTKMLVPSSLGILPGETVTVAPVISSVAPVVSEPAPEVSAPVVAPSEVEPVEVVPEVAPAVITPDPLG